MAIIIRHLEGPLAGQEQSFGNSAGVIVFGRSLECQVVYPLECVEIGRKHFALRLSPSGDYQVELFGNSYVQVDGIPAENGTLVRSGSVITLGRPTGPSFKVKLVSEMAEIAWSPENLDLAEDRLKDPLLEPEERLADLFFRRRAEIPAVVAGIAPTDARN